MRHLAGWAFAAFLAATGCGGGSVRPDAGCRLECAAPPPGCAWVGGDGCTSCGALECADGGGEDAGCMASCPAPPTGCRYVGGDPCACGALECDDVHCAAAGEEHFPAFARECERAADCALVEHQVDCCGSLAARGIRADEVPAFEVAEASCRAMYPACDCAARPTVADDETAGDGTRAARAECVSGACTSTFGLAEGEVCGAEVGACGAGLACCYPCGIPGCDFRCVPACDPSEPGCAGGCVPRP
ncbi:MAG: hypothetical protein KF729_02075 [Sandaracinaceae bacterium]|nr:hypothetical protein [Sandaracinaceae bacterium]